MDRDPIAAVRVLSGFDDPYVLGRFFIWLRLYLVVVCKKVFKGRRVSVFHVVGDRHELERLASFAESTNLYPCKYLYKFLNSSFFECNCRHPSTWL